MRGFPRSNPGYGFGGPRYPGTFLLALREAFAQQKWQIRRWLNDAVECTDANGREQTLALENLYRRVKPIERASWPEVLNEFLAQIPDEALVNPPVSLAEVADRVLVRLGPPFSTQDPEVDVWSQHIAGSLIVATLVIDYPNSMAYVTGQMIAESGHDGDYWLQCAVQNLRGSTPAGCLTEVHAESGLLQCDIGDAYDSSRALLLDDLLPAHAENGCFVSVPGRDHLLVLPVGPQSLAFLPWLRNIAMRTHRNLPYPISAELFWVCRGVWRHFPIEIQGEKALVNPPPEFLEVLARIAPDLPEADPGAADEGEVPD
jgi:hypothetical protein